jgi:2-beta-glucuronyltransferase
MKRCVLLTTHVWRSKRKAGFHWIADALWRQGWEVLFFTDYLSWIDRLKGDYRFAAIPPGAPGRLVKEQERLYSFVWFNTWRPVSLRFRALDRLTYRLMRSYGRLEIDRKAESMMRGADLFIFESSMGLLLFDRLKRLNPAARFVYRVSDDLRLSHEHPIIRDVEAMVAPRFDLVSSPTQYIHEKFARLANARLHNHGVPVHLYDKPCSNPFHGKEGPHAVFVGNLRFDHDFLERASRLLPEIRFHIIGPIAGLIRRSNVVAYGEMPYEETVPYVKHADFGLNPRVGPSLADSNKVMQYTYCRLPIVASAVNRSDRPHVFYYEFGDNASIRLAVRDALAFDRRLIRVDAVASWDSLARKLAGEERQCA